MSNIEGKAVARGIPYSPYKLRPIADVIRNKSIKYALNWLNVYKNRKSEPIKKAVESALANAKFAGCDLSEGEIYINEIRVDQGIIRKYFIPGAQGRVSFQRRRFCHISVKVGFKKAKVSSNVSSKKANDVRGV